MATLPQAKKQCAAHGFEIDESVSNWNAMQGGRATIDPIGNNSLWGECRGIVIFDFTATRAEFWQMVIDAARENADSLTPCVSHDCEFHYSE